MAGSDELATVGELDTYHTRGTMLGLARDHALHEPAGVVGDDHLPLLELAELDLA